MTAETHTIQATADEMFHTTFVASGLGAVAKIDRLLELGDEMTGLLGEGGDASRFGTGEAIQGAAMLACLPSLIQQSTGHPHNERVATAVHDRLHDVATEMVETGVTRSRDCNIKGALSEFSVLSVLWGGVAYGYFAPDSYALLTHSRTNQSTPGCLRDGFDIRFRLGGKKPKTHAVQVKTSESSQDKTYEPNIRVVHPYKLAGEETPRARANEDILLAFARGHISFLDKAVQRAAAMLVHPSTQRGRR